VRLVAEKRLEFKGTARIRLEQLHLPWNDAKEAWLSQTESANNLRARRVHPPMVHTPQWSTPIGLNMKILVQSSTPRLPNTLQL